MRGDRRSIGRLQVALTVRATFFAGVTALAFPTVVMVQQPALAQQPDTAANAAAPARKPFNPAVLKGAPMPDTVMVVILAKSALLALNHANKTNDYRVFRALATPGFQKRNTAKALAKTFAWYRDNKIDLDPIVVLRPLFNAGPSVGDDGLLSVQGVFPSKPLGIQFQLAFLPVEQAWKLEAISVVAAPIQFRN